MEDIGWTTVVNKKKIKRSHRKETQKYIDKKTALRYQKDSNILGLASLLLSTESRNLQEDGWYFFTVIKGDLPLPSDTEDEKYISLPVHNKWNDMAVFCKKEYVEEDE